ncbi:hypothetical protein GALMADRAFT_250630 [Galerina marginata CBS 339.88]|uniref:MARVEL domain-containing protein n=1 Tax=Galerina marginata (strain CBS 339.88) TaxID=685588 RepID=A0A067SV94_GALM3|nr:hypothetical protein GALMADRAFT_250630 [Galerina marginata CBS 339.88]
MLCSITVCALSALLLSWLNSLSQPDRTFVSSEFDDTPLALELGASLGSLVALMVFFVWAQNQKVNWPKYFVRWIWFGAMIASIFYLVKTKWQPCQLLIFEDPVGIPHATSTCRKITAVNILSIVSIFSILASMFASCHIGEKRRSRTSTNIAQVCNINNPVRDDIGVDLGELARHISTVDGNTRMTITAE